MNSIFTRLRNAQFNSRLGRNILGVFYRNGRVYTVPFGPLRGIKLRYCPDINFHVMLGMWELQNLRFLSRVLLESGLLRRDSVVCDVGANVGVFSLWLGRRCVPQGQIYAFEVAPVTLDRFRDNLLLNNVKNVEVIPAACADRNGPVEFFIGHHHHSNSLNADWSGAGHPPALDSLAQPLRAIKPRGCFGNRMYGSKPENSRCFIRRIAKKRSPFRQRIHTLAAQRA